MLRFTAARTLSAALLAVATPAVAAGAQRFEGVIHATITTDRRSQDVSYTIKGDKTRMETNAGPMGTMAMITDPATHKVTMLMAMRQMYMEHDIDTTMHAEQQGQGSTSIKWTGKTETIAGYQCEHANVTSSTSNDQYDVCIAKGLGNFFGGQGGMGRGGRGGGPGSDWQRLVHGGFPLKVQKVGDSNPVFVVTKIDKQSVDDSQFSVPAGFMKMDMPMMGRP